MGEAKRKRDRYLAEHGQPSHSSPTDGRSALLTPVPSPNIGILQLSDIHIGTPQDLILNRAEAIARSTNTLSHPVALWIILVSGDIARNGKEAEYQIAERFLNEVRRHVKSFHPTSEVEFVLIPGNHDCDFGLDVRARQMLLQPIAKNADSADVSIVDTCLCVQRPFFDFAGRLETGTVVPSPALTYTRVFTVGGPTVRFTCYNTAWLSQKEEKPGDLAFPTQLPHMVEPPDDVESCAVSVSVFHHPVGWLRPENKRLLQTYIERTSDLIFTGHEHAVGQYHKANITGETVEYCEGGALQMEPKDRAAPATATESTFNVVEVDTTTKRHRFTQYEWVRSQYTPAKRTEWRPFIYGAERQSGLTFTDTFQRTLDDPGAQFTHPAREHIVLDDIFVYPDFNELRIPPPNRPRVSIFRGDIISSRIGPSDLSHVLIYGPDDCGKTTFAKRLCRDLTRRQLATVFISMSQFKATDPDAIAESVHQQELLQYGAVRCARISQLEPARRAIIIDGVQHQVLQHKQIVDALRASFGTIVVLGGDLLKLTDLPLAASATSPFFDFKRFDLLPFGQERRGQLIARWFELSRQAGANEEIVAKKARAASQAINAATNSDLMPSYPLFMLIILQTYEAAQSLDSPASHSRSYGYLNESLIARALSDHAPTDVDTSYKYLSELAYRMYAGSVRRLSEPELRGQHESYCREYAVSLDFKEMLAFLLRVGVIGPEAGGQYEFKYRYIYHYCVARALRDDSRRFDEHVDRLVNGLHREQSAGVLMFLVYLVRDERVVDRMLAKARELYSHASECDLDKDVSRFSELNSEPRELVLPATSPDHNHGQLLAQRDEAAVSEYRAASDEGAASDEVNDVIRVNAALKTIEILGQVVRSFAGSTRADRKQEIVRECYSLGLRAMKALVLLILENREIMLADLERHLREKGLSEEEIGGKASHFVYWLGEAWVLVFLLKTSQAVGLDTLSQTYDEIVERDKSLGVWFVDLAVRLESFSSFPENMIEDLVQKTANLPFTRRVLSRLVYRHMYLYKVDRRLRERLASKLKIRTDFPALQLQAKFGRN